MAMYIEQRECFEVQHLLLYLFQKKCVCVLI